MSRYKIATLIGGAGIDSNGLDSDELIALLHKARPDLFTDNAVEDFHLHRYVIIHSAPTRDAALAWAEAHSVNLHGTIENHDEVYALYMGWTGLIDFDLPTL
jgi:hypothetical protein